MWRNRSTGDADYEVPKGSGEYVIYAGSLWLGGTDRNNQLKLAAMRYSGNDFWTGPLSYDENQPFDVAQGQLGYGPQILHHKYVKNMTNSTLLLDRRLKCLMVGMSVH